MREHLLQICCVLRAITRIMQLSIHKVEDVIARDITAQRIPVNLLNLIRDVVYPYVPVNNFADLTVGTVFALLDDVPLTEQTTVLSINWRPRERPGF